MSFEKHDNAVNFDTTSSDALSNEAARCWTPEEHSYHTSIQNSHEVNAPANPLQTSDTEWHPSRPGDAVSKPAHDNLVSHGDKTKTNEPLQKILEEREQQKMKKALEQASKSLLEDQEIKKAIEEATKKLIEDTTKKMLEQAVKQGLIELPGKPDAQGVMKPARPDAMLLPDGTEVTIKPGYTGPIADEHHPKTGPMDEQHVPTPSLPDDAIVVTPLYETKKR